MNLIKIPALSACIVNNEKLLCTIKAEDQRSLELVEVNTRKETKSIICKFKGSNSLLLTTFNDKVLVGIDNKLLMSDDLFSWDTVLEAKVATNVFSHMTRSNDGTIYVQEYGEPPTGIYMVRDGEGWELLKRAQDIDKTARHFHNVAYDAYRNILIVTLGDGNLVRAAVSYDLGRQWRPIYKGAWQTVPIVVLKNSVVFGMDSGISRGGVLIWYPGRGRWEAIHAKWENRGVRLAQMCDLKLLNNDLWVAALGTPQAIIASSDLKKWYPIHIEGFDKILNPYLAISEGKDLVAFTTGRNLLLAHKDELKDAVKRGKPVMKTCRAYVERLVGLGHVFKKRFVSEINRVWLR